MPDYSFETPGPVRLLVEIGRGRVDLRAVPTTQTTVAVTGPDADDVTVVQDGDQILVHAPRRRTGFLGTERELNVTATIPEHSEVQVRTGSADIAVEGTVGACRLRTGSGDVTVDTATGPLVVESGSGDIAIDAAGAELRVKTGSGDLRIGRIADNAVLSAGSGDVVIDQVHGQTVVKTGSGDVAVEDAHADVSVSTGSGDLIIGTAHGGRVNATGASGDLHVGVPSGLPVWTDIHTVTGSIRSDLAAVGEPGEGQAHLEVRAKTTTGDIVLRQH